MRLFIAIGSGYYIYITLFLQLHASKINILAKARFVR